MRYFQKSDKPSVRFFQKSGSAQSFFSKNSKSGSTRHHGLHHEKEKKVYSPLERRHNPY